MADSLYYMSAISQGGCLSVYAEGIQYGYRKQLLDFIAKANTIKSE